MIYNVANQKYTTNKQTKEDIETLKENKADKASTLSGYGIKDAYTKEQTNKLKSRTYIAEGDIFGQVVLAPKNLKELLEEYDTIIIPSNTKVVIMSSANTILPTNKTIIGEDRLTSTFSIANDRSDKPILEVYGKIKNTQLKIVHANYGLKVGHEGEINNCDLTASNVENPVLEINGLVNECSFKNYKTLLINNGCLTKCNCSTETQIQIISDQNNASGVMSYCNVEEVQLKSNNCILHHNNIKTLVNNGYSEDLITDNIINNIAQSDINDILDGDGKVLTERLPDNLLKNQAENTGINLNINNTIEINNDEENNDFSISLGSEASSADYGVAIGHMASAENGNSVAIGNEAKAAKNAIQIGEGQNQIEGTLQVFKHQLLNAEGKIPNERLKFDVSRVNYYISSEFNAKENTDVQCLGMNFIRADFLLNCGGGLWVPFSIPIYQIQTSPRTYYVETSDLEHPTVTINSIGYDSSGATIINFKASHPGEVVLSTLWFKQ